LKEQRRLTERSRREAGFTLIELMVVLAILVLLVGLVGPRVIGIFSKAKPQVARVQIHELGAALDHFYLDVGRYPTTDEGLRALTQRPGNLSTWTGMDPI
jgi:general secretion pathway protein G